MADYPEEMEIDSKTEQYFEEEADYSTYPKNPLNTPPTSITKGTISAPFRKKHPRRATTVTTRNAANATRPPAHREERKRRDELLPKGEGGGG
jgi:hypothetical protein